MAYAKAEVYPSTEANSLANVEARAKDYVENEANTYADAQARANVDAGVKQVAALYNPVTDCLRLLMHFFHPIQQCAQQVYHTAVPLSPTSSELHKSCLQSVINNQLSHVTAFLGAPSFWGSSLRTIDIRPKELTYITTSGHWIVTACEDVVNIYDAVTGVPQQPLHAPEPITKIQGLPDGSTLFFAHCLSMTMWDVQTGGLTHTFTTQSKINDIAVSTTGGHVACGSSDGFVSFWNIHTKEEGKGFGDPQPVITLCWLSPEELAVATQNTLYIHDIVGNYTLDRLFMSGHVWGMVYLVDEREFLVGTSQPGDQELCTLESIKYTLLKELVGLSTPTKEFVEWTSGQGWEGWEPPAPPPPGQLVHPTLVDEEIVCITPPTGVRLFNTRSRCWTDGHQLLSTVTSVAISLNRNLVVQDKDYIQIFPIDVLTRGKADQNHKHLSHIYPLGKSHIICILQTKGDIVLFDLETLTEQPPFSRASFGDGLVVGFDVSLAMRVWQTGIPLSEWTVGAQEDALLSSLSPECTRVVTVYGSPRRELRVGDACDGTTLANLSLGDGDFGPGEVYDLTFDSETRFYLRIDGPGRHIQIPCDVIASRSGHYPHTIYKGEPVPLSEPRATPPYALDAGCEWVLDAESRKICWVSPGNVRRGNGGHFWVGPSLVMVGDDGVVRKLSLKDPSC